ncbi:MAG: extracellular solute-binding protein [Anaerolineae bacterium]|nr:MAG: extracellular solute-binding protein [Anaerolineae bacterium]
MGRFFILLLIYVVLLGTVTAQETPPPDVTTIQVWWPDALYNANDQHITDTLEMQLDDFAEAHLFIAVEVRLKRSEGQGSVISTLLAAEEVAPGAIPDLVLLRRDDLAQAVRAGIARPIDDWVPDTLRDDLLPNALSLGQIDGRLYGMPYLLRIDHTAFRTATYETAPLTYEDVLNSEAGFLQPGAPLPNQAVNNVILGQYLAEGGRLVDENGFPILDQAALLTVLTFYEAGVQQQIFSPEILSYDLPSDYWSRFAQGEAPLALVSSTDFLQRQSSLQNIAAAPIPTEGGTSLTLLDGWMWVLTTGDPDQKNGALEFLKWMMRADQQAEFSESIGILPSLAPALRIWSNDAYTRQITAWLPESIVLPVDQRNNPAAVQLQAAFVAVLNGVSADEAVETALKNLTTN